jgi:sugar phosphate isomerase/epimerase
VRAEALTTCGSSSRGGQDGRAGGQHLRRRRRARPLRENIEAARGFLPDLVAYARDHGVKLAIENCPMIFSQDEWPGGHNLFYAPATWREIFGWFDDDTLGSTWTPRTWSGR